MIRAMRILQVHNLQMNRGGTDVVQEREATLLREHGHAVERFTVDNKDIEGLNSIQTGLKAIWNTAASASIKNMIADFKPDIAHVHTPFPILSPAIFRAIKSIGVPTVATMHSYRFTCVNALLYRDGQVCEECVGKRLSWPAIAHKCYKNSRLASSAMVASLATHHLLRTFQNHVDTYITLTEFARQKLITDHFPAEKIVVKPNFVICDQPPGKGDGGYALYVGRLVAEKGVDALVDAWSELGPEQLKLKVVGDGPLRDSLSERATRSVGPAIEFLGWKDTSEVLALMRDASYLVFPSQWYEAGCTLVMMEAFASGTPVLASDVGNFSEAIRPGENGWLFKSGDANDLATMVRKIESDSTLQQIRKNCYAEYQQRYSPDANYQMLMSIYGKHVN